MGKINSKCPYCEFWMPNQFFDLKNNICFDCQKKKKLKDGVEK